MQIQEAIKHLIQGQDLSQIQMHNVMQSIMAGETTNAQIGAFLVALSIKGESIDEITASAKVMRELATKVTTQSKQYLVDTCGTGGDKIGLFNISTAAAFVTAAAGAKVAKHGNRSISSKCGSADVLEQAGVNLSAKPDLIAKCIDEIGIGFIFAPAHHSAMKNAIAPRKELAIRTIFNVLGPLTNPAQTPNQIIGVYSKDLVETIAKVLKKLGSRHIMVVHSKDGLDEISIADDTYVCELKNDSISSYTINPLDFGINKSNLEDIMVTDAKQSIKLITDAFNGKSGPARDIIALNAGAAIYVSGIKKTLADGIKYANELLKNGSANEKFKKYIKTSNE